MIRAAIYCRVSTDKQEKEGTSLETQEEACRAYASERLYVLTAAPFLDTFTGSVWRKRPGLSALRKIIREGSIDVVIVHAVDRLSRNVGHLAILVDEAEEHNVRLEFVTEKLDDTPEGKLMMSLRGYVAEVEREKIISRSKAGREARARGGKPIPGGSEPLGLKWIWEPVRGKPGEHSRFTVAGYEPDPAKAGLAWRIFKDVANGVSATKLAEVFNQEGIPTQKGGARWHATTIRAIVRNPIYKGEYQALRRQYEMEKGKRNSGKDRPESERVRIPDVAPALVSPELWQAANDQLALNRTESRRPGIPRETYLLRAGFIRCGYCGGSIVADRMISHGKTIIPRYRCTPMNKYQFGCPGGGSITQRELDAAVWDRVKAIRLHPEILLREIEQQVAQDDTTEADVAAINGRLAQIEREISKTSRIIAQLDEDVSGDFIGKLNLLGREKKALIADRCEVEERRADLVAGQTLLEQLWQQVDQGMDNAETELANLSYQEKRQLLHRLGVKVKLWKKDHEPRYEITTAIAIREFDPTSETIPEPQPMPGNEHWSRVIPADIDLGPIANRVKADSTSTSCSVPCTT
jgi:site-specific DNA recombinase